MGGDNYMMAGLRLNSRPAARSDPPCRSLFAPIASCPSRLPTWTPSANASRLRLRNLPLGPYRLAGGGPLFWRPNDGNPPLATHRWQPTAGGPPLATHRWRPSLSVAGFARGGDAGHAVVAWAIRRPHGRRLVVGWSSAGYRPSAARTAGAGRLEKAFFEGKPV